LNPESHIFISSSKKNESHDLRLVKTLKLDFDDIFNIVHKKPIDATFVETDKILNKIAYGSGIHNIDNITYGTRENLKTNNRKIYNVNGVYKALKTSVEMPEVSSENQKIYNKITNFLGIFHIYDDGRPMKYESI
jgi:hypothetical protein